MRLGMQEVSIKALMRRDWLDTEMRTAINTQKVVQYASEMKDGDWKLLCAHCAAVSFNQSAIVTVFMNGSMPLNVNVH